MSCSCGVNKKISGNSCAPNPFYATRCKCYLTQQPCTSLCRCKDCCNPHGAKSIATCCGVKRNRHYHSHQKEVHIPSSKKFALDRGECISVGIWSDFETLVLNEVHEISKRTDLDKTKLYNDVVHYTHSKFCITPIPEGIVFREKTCTQVNSKLQFECL